MNGSLFCKNEIPITQLLQCASLDEDFKCCQCIFAISISSFLDKGRGHSFEQIWIPFTKGCFVPRVICTFNWPSDSGKQIFICRQCIFAISISFSFGRVIDPSFEQLLLCAKLFQMSIYMFFAIFYYFFNKCSDIIKASCKCVNWLELLLGCLMFLVIT